MTTRRSVTKSRTRCLRASYAFHVAQQPRETLKTLFSRVGAYRAACFLRYRTGRVRNRRSMPLARKAPIEGVLNHFGLFNTGGRCRGLRVAIIQLSLISEKVAAISGTADAAWTRFRPRAFRSHDRLWNHSVKCRHPIYAMFVFFFC